MGRKLTYNGRLALVTLMASTVHSERSCEARAELNVGQVCILTPDFYEKTYIVTKAAILMYIC